MVIFTGQLKKRNVNIGGGYKNNRSSLIHQTQKEREKREQERLRERQVVTIQQAIRRYRELHQFKTQIGEQWTIAENINQTVFLFNLFYAFIYKTNASKLNEIQKLDDFLKSVNINDIGSSNISGLLRSIVKSLESIDLQKSIDVETLPHLLNISQRIFPMISSSRYEIIPILSKLVHQLYNVIDCQQIFNIINLFSSLEAGNYIKFISSSIIPELKNLEINYESASTIQSFDLSTDKKLLLLSNLILKRRSFTEEVIIAISNVISSIHVSLVTKTEQFFENERATSEDDDDGEGRSERNREIITDELNETINVLYSTEFITTASRLLEPHKASLLYGCLISLKPMMKSSLIIHLIPRTFEPLLQSILANDIFNRIIGCRESSFFAISSDLIKEIFIDEAEFLLSDISIFLQLLQYRLITSNDFEIFKGYDFTIEKFEKTSLFLKKFVFNFIWNHSKIFNFPQVSSRFLELKKLAITVLNQIYLKNSRINVLDNDIWLLEALDLSNLVNLIVRHEDYKYKNDGYNSDDDLDGKNFEYLPNIDASSQARLEIFMKTPFFISFAKRVEIFQVLVEMDREKSTQSSGSFYNPFSQFVGAKESATIRREYLLQDAFDSFNKIGAGLKNPLNIQFVNEHGAEEGIDGGGITKEFLTSVVQDAISKDFFVENSQHELYPNPSIGIKYLYRENSEEQLQKLNYIKFFGKIVGKCLYERVLVDMNFASFFLMKLNSSFKNSFDDLKSMDIELHANLVKLLQLSEDELNSLSLTFSIDEKITENKTISVDLIPNGSITPVTVSNRLKFIHEMSNYKLNKTMSLQSNYFLSGLYEMISKDWLTMFNPYELQLLISGENEVNVQDLKANTVYGGFNETDETIVYLWQIVDEMSRHDRSQFVKFATSVPKAPLLGFKVLNPKFGIANDGSNTNRLPTSSTCVNLLRLPNYRNKEVLREKLLYAINSEARFDLA